MTDDEFRPKQNVTGFAALADLSFTKLPEHREVGESPDQPLQDSSPRQAEAPLKVPPAASPSVPHREKKAETGGRSFLANKVGLFWTAVALGSIASIYASNLSPKSPLKAAVPTSVEVPPPPGTGQLLTSDQIRYCLSESIRLDGARGSLNTYNQFDIDRFNSMIVDYNSRCGNFRYRPGSLDGIRAAVEANRSRLDFEGAARFSR